MSLIYLVVIVIFLLIIVEVLSLALRLTGLDRDKATFQVISIITGTGFTTSEAELITQHKTRRKIASLLMLISYVGQATIIGMGLGLITSISGLDNIALSGVILLAAIVLLYIIARNKWAMARVESFVNKAIRKKSKINKNRTVDEVLKLGNGFGVVEFLIDDRNPLVDVTLKYSGLKTQQIQVLNVERGDQIIKFPRWSLKFREGDKVLVYGNIENISKVASEKIDES